MAPCKRKAGGIPSAEQTHENLQHLRQMRIDGRMPSATVTALDTLPGMDWELVGPPCDQKRLDWAVGALSQAAIVAHECIAGPGWIWTLSDAEKTQLQLANVLGKLSPAARQSVESKHPGGWVWASWDDHLDALQHWMSCIPTRSTVNIQRAIQHRGLAIGAFVIEMRAVRARMHEENAKNTSV